MEDVAGRDAAPPEEEPPSPVASRITNSVLSHVGEIVRDCGASALLVYLDALSGRPLELPDSPSLRVFLITKDPAEDARAEESGVHYIRAPKVGLSRTGQVKIAVFLALSRGWIHRGEVLVCLSGLAGSGQLDTVVVVEVGRENELFVALPEGPQGAARARPEVVERVIELATELGSEGREGRPVGALFVAGDTERVQSLSRQLILNPFRGYPEEERNLLDPRLAETVKELATVDGAFLVRGDGVIESAGVYLKTGSQEQSDLPKGLGSRHHAAAGITAVSDAVAVVVSQSTGTVTIFRNGKIVTAIERAHAVPGGGTTERP